jgi:uncharacterized protein
MTTPSFPGITFVESLLPPAQPTGSAVSSPCVVGAHPRGPINSVGLVNSWSDFTTLFGGFSPGVAPTPFQLAIYTLLAQGGRPVYCVRVPQGTEVTATVTLDDREVDPVASLVATALNPGAWGNNIAISWQDTSTDPDATPRGTFGVWFNGVLVERYLQVSYDPTDSRYVVDQVNQKSNYITIVDDSSAETSIADRTPAETGTGGPPITVVVPVSLTAGTDDAAVPALGQWQAAEQLLNAIAAPLDINLAGISLAPTINSALAYAEDRGDSFVVIDSAAGDTSTEACTLAATYEGNSTTTSYGAVYWPRVVIADPSRPVSSAATVVIGAGGPVLGQYCLNDVNFGPEKAPAGYGTSLALVVGLEVTPSAFDLSTCQNSVPAINALRLVPGNGVCIMGARTLQTDGNDDRFVNVRRSLIYIEANLAAIAGPYLFDDNDAALWTEITAALAAWLTTFWQAGGLAGATADDAYFVTCDDTNNTDLTVENGETLVTVGVALQKPSEFMIFTISQISGSTSVAEAA